MTMLERRIDELKRAGLLDKDGLYNGGIGEAVKELLEVFYKQGHSGASSALTAKYFKALADGRVILPLRGTPDEWTETETGHYQNKRDSAVFAKGPNGEGAYFIRGYIFVDKGGCAFTCRDSWVNITFPCVPYTVKIKEGTPDAEPFAHVFKDRWKN